MITLADEPVAAAANPSGRTATRKEEWALYAPVKAFLERQGYEVKGEVRGCDVVGCRAGEKPVIVELKLRFGLPLLLQGLDRLALSDRVYLAVPRPLRRTANVVPPDAPAIRKLCRRVGVGLMLVADREVMVLEEPVPYKPRRAKRRAEQLLNEFARRVGDANVGGRNRCPIVTAYRQDALRCADALAGAGMLKVAALRQATGIPNVASILQRNVYGWFERVERGSYRLTDAGHAALGQFAEAVTALAEASAATTGSALPSLAPA